jgi:hypothetical protein
MFPPSIICKWLVLEEKHKEKAGEDKKIGFIFLIAVFIIE